MMAAPEKTFRRYDPRQTLLLPPDLRDWLPEGHLAYFVSDVVDELDLAPIYARYDEARGYPPYEPRMMVKVLVYAYCVGMRSSRQISSATRENVAFRVLAANNFPDFRTLCRFRAEHAEAFRVLFRQVLQLCSREGLVDMHVVALDGTKVKANANLLENRNRQELEGEAEELDRVAERVLREAEETDEREDAELGEEDGSTLPPQLRQRKGRRERIAESLRQIEEEERRRAAELERKVEERKRKEAEEASKGKKVRGRKPKLELEEKTLLRNVSDPDSRVMIPGGLKVSAGGYLQGYNAQVVVDCDSQVIVAEDVVQDCNDERQLLPMLEHIRSNLSRVPGKLLADSGYFCTEMVQQAGDVDLYVATRSSYDVRAGEPPKNSIREGSVREAMEAKLASEQGHALFACRSRTVECVFGQIKEDRGLRRFLLRGLDKVRSEWTLACLGHNLKKMWSRGNATRNRSA